ncbi:MAG: HAMP domain-containing histidine kinase [Planctomycetes bacterium]|nr:HAMP domain-containing histidine kinase [Planctomycetota bacterium]
MIGRRRRTAWGFVAVAAVMLAVLGWLTVALLHLDLDEREARHQAALHDRLRLALWRMDSWLSPQLALEAMRPASDYAPFPSADNAWTNGFSKIEPNLVRVPSPLLGAESPLFPLHFEIGPQGFCSPQVPTGNERDFAEGNGVDSGVLDRAATRLRDVQRVIGDGSLEAKVGAAEAQLLTMGCNPISAAAPVQTQQSVQELSNRQMAVRNFAMSRDNVQAAYNGLLPRSVETVGALVPAWVDGSPDLLVYVRRVHSDAGARLQAVLVDWPRMQQEMLALAADLFDDWDVQLTRCDAPQPAEQPSMLASVPARLVTTYRGPAVRSQLPVSAILWTTWGVTLLGLGVLGFTLRAAIGFGERRARFASAVTHELRTPLTTFRMYSEMLAEGIVTDPAAQRDYLQTLQRESDRLSRVVENVLAWSRLEEGRFAARRERVAVRGLVERFVPVLRQRLAEVELDLEVRIDDAARDAVVVTDEDAVGQILFNLIDNAAKYARGAAQREVTLTLRRGRGDGDVELVICDRGPGVPSEHRERIFVPFDRGAVMASSNDVPGVGLGLPLARGLARDLGGDLRLCDNPGGGACFALSLSSA